LVEAGPTTAALQFDSTRIVSFGADLTPFLAQGVKVADWSATPSVSEDYRAARDYIRKKLEDLVKEIKKQ
jgi:hypothetical protein